MFLEVGTDLACETVTKLLDQAGAGRDEVDYLLLINSTGLATPSLDARVINRLGLPATSAAPPMPGLLDSRSPADSLSQSRPGQQIARPDTTAEVCVVPGAPNPKGGTA